MASRTSAAELTAKSSTSDAMSSTSTQSAGTDSVLETLFSDMPQLLEFWRQPNDPDVLKSGSIEVLGTTAPPPAKRLKKDSSQATAKSQATSYPDSSVVMDAFLFVYDMMKVEIATSHSNGDDNQSLKLPTAETIDRLKSPLSLFGLKDPLASMILDGARILLQSRLLRDGRYETLEKLAIALKSLATVIEKFLRSYHSPEIRQTPRLGLQDSKVVIVEDEAMARRFEQANKAMEAPKSAVVALLQEWTRIDQLEEVHLRANDASRQDDHDSVESMSASEHSTTSPMASKLAILPDRSFDYPFDEYLG
ncbi:hypothetical protein AYL99_04922 [Fonsecaea erecta]|uniref:Uncharacterized protein n=1 Tax=Fonsecaea erecta TaxID=1367422 RepID=A0A178ZJE6_9EURO|nr:hypothetical protein AYL99_04922 [Fonsecaea erecta]OAP59920.1 hypothetical protein AYL99_04922 [Fonsecaea erecta]